MPANRPNNPRAFVSPNNPSGSFKVTWTRGANEVNRWSGVVNRWSSVVNIWSGVVNR